MKKILPVIFLFLFSLYAVKALFHNGFYTSHDGEHQVIRLYRFMENLKDGQIPPRWAKDLDNGYGYPLFNFTYQSPWFLGILLLKLGFSLTDSIKGVFILGYVLSGLIMFFWLKRKTGNLGGFLGSFLYLWAPYRFSNIFVRASLGEATIFIFLPLLFWGTEKAGEKKNNLGGIFLIAIGLSGIILSHLMGLIIIALPWFFWVILHLILSQNKKASLLRIASGIILGVLLSAYYFIPAILEKVLTNANQLLTSYYMDHFVSISQLFYSKWGYGFDFPGTVNDAMSFQVGITQWFIIFFSFLLLVLLIIKQKKNFPKMLTSNYAVLILFFSLISFCYSVFMMLPQSNVIWQLIVKHSYFDFPWRFLCLSVFMSSISCAYLIYLADHLKTRLALGKIMTFYGPAIIIVIITLYTNRNYLRVNKYIYPPDSYYIRNTNTTNQYDEYRPKTLDSNYIKEKRNILDKNPDVKITKLVYKSGLLTVNGIARQSSLQKINLAYFPGWKISLNKDNQEKIKSDEGIMGVNIPKGNFNLIAKFTDTPIRTFSNILSIIALIITILLLLKKIFHYLTVKKNSL